MPVNYRPRESSTLDNLLRAMRAGLDPQLGYSLFSGVQGDALARAQAAKAAQQAKQAGRRDTLSGLLDALIAQASGGMPQTGASTLAGALGAFPGVGPKMEGRLEGLLGTLYPSVETPGATPTGVGPDLARVHPRTAEGMLSTTAPSEFSPLYQQPGGSPLDQLTTAASAAQSAGTLAPFVSPETLESLLGPALGGMAPELAGGISGALGSGAGGATLDPDDTTAVQQIVEAAATASKPGASDQPPLPSAWGNSLHEVRMGLMQKFRDLGYSQEALAQLYEFIGQLWTYYQGTMPAGPGAPTTLTAPPSAGRFPAPPYG